jgi:peptidoglycan/LPS O-acetylase OafA/YrhL
MNPALQFSFLTVSAAIGTLVLCILVAQLLVRFGTVTFDTKGRLGYIDGLRGFLALGVFFHHYMLAYFYHLTGKWQVPPSVFYTFLGEGGVALFFMVTGFLFWHKLLSKEGRLDWTQLYVSRLFRLVPLYWCVVAVLLVVVAGVGGFTLNVPLSALFLQITSWLLFEGGRDVNAFEDTFRIVAGVTWTLRYEWFFYFSLPLLALAIRASHKVRGLLWLLPLGILALLSQVKAIPYLGISTSYFVYFIVGALAAALYTRQHYRTLAAKPVFSFLALLALILAANVLPQLHVLVKAALLGAFFIPIALGNSLFGLLKHPALLLLGEASYSLYLLHGLLIYIAFDLMFPGFMTARAHPLAIWGSMGLLGMVLVVVSWATFCYLEKPGIALGRKLSQRSPKPVPARQPIN